MKLNEIKIAVDNWDNAYKHNFNMANREIVHWENCSYYVIKRPKLIPYYYEIVYKPNMNSVGLTHKDGHTLNGKKSQFYICKGIECTHEMLDVMERFEKRFKPRNFNETIELVKKETGIKIFNRVSELMNDLEWEKDRMSSSGQETLDKYWKLLDQFRKGKL